MRKIIFLSLLVASIVACKKKDNTGCNAAACPAIYVAPPPLFFNYIDSLTGKFPFWTQPRQYAFNDLVTFRKINSRDTQHIRFTIDSVSVPARFYVIPTKTVDTIYLQIMNQKVDTLQLESRGIVSDCCTVGYLYSSVKLNGKISCAICALTNIIELRR